MARQHARQDDSDHPTCPSRWHESGGGLPPAPGLHVCSACLEIAEETLVELPWLFDLWTHALDPLPNAQLEQVGELRSNGVVLCGAVVSVRAEILGVLAAWCGFVTKERGVPGPDEPVVRKLVGFLGIHLHWLCQHPIAPALVDSLAELSAAISAALYAEMSFLDGNGNGNGNGGSTNGHTDGHEHVTDDERTPRPENAE